MIDASRTDCAVWSIKNILLSRDTADHNTWEPQRHAHTFRISTISPETARSTFQMRPNGYHGRGRFIIIPPDVMSNKRIGTQHNKSTTTRSYTHMTTRRGAAQEKHELIQRQMYIYTWDKQMCVTWKNIRTQKQSMHIADRKNQNEKIVVLTPGRYRPAGNEMRVGVT